MIRSVVPAGFRGLGPMLLAAVMLAAAAPPAGAVDALYRNNIQTARRFMSRGQPEPAAKIYQQVLRDHPDDPTATGGYAEALIAMKKLDDADAFLTEALGRIDKKVDLYRVRSELRVAQKRYDDAFGDVLRVMELDQARATWAVRRARDLLGSGLEVKKAEKLAAEERKSHPEMTTLTIMQGVVMNLGGKPDEALALVTKVDDEGKMRGQAVSNYADQLFALGEEEDAVAALQSAAARVDQPPIRSKILYRVAEIQESEGRYRDALANLDRIVQERQGTSAAGKALLMAADIYQKHLNDPEGALSVYTKIKDDPMLGHRKPEMLLQMGECYVRLGRFGKASAAYAEVAPISVDPEEVEKAAFEQAEVQFYRGDFDSAMVLYQDMAQAHPRSLLADDAAGRYIMLNKYQALGGGAAVQALGKMDWARAAGDTAVVDSVADLLIGTYSGGELAAEACLAKAEVAPTPEAALGYLDKLVDEHKDDRRAPVALMRAGDLLRNKLNRPGEALVRYESILTDYPESLEAPEARRLVEKLRRDIKS
jgi:tetratricopeptide (TPR) repeat protein